MTGAFLLYHFALLFVGFPVLSSVLSTAVFGLLAISAAEDGLVVADLACFVLSVHQLNDDITCWIRRKELTDTVNM